MKPLYTIEEYERQIFWTDVQIVAIIVAVVLAFAGAILWF